MDKFDREIIASLWENARTSYKDLGERVSLSPNTTAVKFEAELQKISGILEATLMTGAFDYMLRVACRDQEALVRLTEELRAGGLVQETYTRMPLRTVKLSGAMT